MTRSDGHLLYLQWAVFSYNVVPYIHVHDEYRYLPKAGVFILHYTSQGRVYRSGYESFWLSA